MIAPEKVQLLQRFLQSLPPSMASRLAKAVEVDRLSDGKALPHSLILDGLRPVLRQTEPSRVLSPTRVFCRPFEDLLIDRPTGEKQRGRIARETINPVWNWLSETLTPDAHKAFVDSVKDAVLGLQREVAISFAAEYWPIASAAILSALSDEAGRKAARHALGSDALVEDAREIALLLAVGTDILELQTLLEKPVGHLSDDLMWQMRDLYQRVADKLPEAGPYVAVVVMGRMARPWEALKLPLFISRQTGETMLASTDMGLVGEVLFGDIDDQLSVIRSARPNQFDPDKLIGALAAFSELSTGLVKQVELRRDGKWGQRLMHARAAVAEVLEGFTERGPREILAMLPTHRASFSGGPKAPDLARKPDPDRRERGFNYARLLAGCEPFAAAASFGAALMNAIDEIRAGLSAYGDDLVQELRTVEGDKRAHAEVYLEIVVELTGLFSDPKDADLLRRRARAAATSAAA